MQVLRFDGENDRFSPEYSQLVSAGYSHVVFLLNVLATALINIADYDVLGQANLFLEKG